MTRIIVILPLLAASGHVPGQVDRVCQHSCEILAVQQGRVRLIDQAPPSGMLISGGTSRLHKPSYPESKPQSAICRPREGGAWSPAFIWITRRWAR